MIEIAKQNKKYLLVLQTKSREEKNDLSIIELHFVCVVQF